MQIDLLGRAIERYWKLVKISFCSSDTPDERIVELNMDLLVPTSFDNDKCLAAINASIQKWNIMKGVKIFDATHERFKTLHEAQHFAKFSNGWVNHHTFAICPLVFTSEVKVSEEMSHNIYIAMDNAKADGYLSVYG